MNEITTTHFRQTGIFFRIPKIIRRFRRSDDGATAIEFAILAVPFFVLLMGIIECSLIFFAGQMLDSTTDNIGRKIRTGQMDNTVSESTFKTALCNEAAILFDCSKIHVDLQVADDFSELGDPPLPDSASNSVDFTKYSFTAPCPEEITMITASYEWPIFTYFVSDNIYRTVSGSTGNPAFRKILLNAISVFRTEPFPAGTGGRTC